MRFVFAFLMIISNYYLVAQTSKSENGNLETIFLNPPNSAKPGVLWMWMGSNINKEKITADLEALKKEGFNRTTMFSLADVTIPWSAIIKKSPTPQIISWTEPWWELVRFAAQESKRLDMDFGTFNGPGYESSGGNWITPDKSMQEICYVENRVNSKNELIKLWLSTPNLNPRANMYYPVYDLKSGLVEYPVIPARQNYFKDIAVIAMPAEGVVDAKDIIDISSYMKSDGTLEWFAPKGQWIIYRFGHTTMGALIQPAQPEATGLECDKMSQEAVESHLNKIIGDIKSHLGDLIGTGFTHVHFDSYEAGNPTWTPLMRKEFNERRGYDLLPYLATFANRIVGDKNTTKKFKDDFSTTIKDLYRDVYFKTIARKLKEANLQFLCEPYGGPWRQDDIMPYIGTVMTEFWTRNGSYSPYELDSTVAALRKSGQNIIEAEAFTGQPQDSKWSEYPAWIKPIGDAAFCAGVNKMVLHRFTHQPWDEKYKPGNTMGQWGTHFDRTQTWWEPGKALVDYWQRCQSLLQWGSIVMKNDNDFKATAITDTIVPDYIHRKSGDVDLYFVANTSHFKGSSNCIFNVYGKTPELWDPVTKEIKKIEEYKIINNQTYLTLAFDDAQSYFVVFKENTSLNSKLDNHNTSKKQNIKLNKSWEVQFDPKWGGPIKPVLFKTLTDWTSNENKGIKYYSGTAVYKTNFKLNDIGFGNEDLITLQLGKVNHIAKVKLNGDEIGVVWTAPWQIKIPVSKIKPNNELTIEVTNVWANRLIGDEQEPDDVEWIPGQYFTYTGKYMKEFPDWFLNNTQRPSKNRYCFTTWNYFDKDAPLIPSGLLGPVEIMVEKN